MLPSFEAAHCVNGRVQKAIAFDCDVTDSTFYKWSTGRMRCPKHKRQSVDRAFGSPVNWSDYDAEVTAIQRIEAERPAEARQSANRVKAAPAPPEAVKTPPAPAPAPRDAFEELYGGCF